MEIDSVKRSVTIMKEEARISNQDKWNEEFNIESWKVNKICEIRVILTY